MSVFQSLFLIQVSVFRGRFLVNGTDEAIDKRDSRTKFTTPECLPFAQTVIRLVRPWQTTFASHSLSNLACCCKVGSHKMDRMPWDSCQKFGWVVLLFKHCSLF